MKAKNFLLALAFFASFSIVADGAFASSGNERIQLGWTPRTEILEYHSCGAADACWVAQIKKRGTQKFVAEIRCDGEKLFSRVWNKAETLVAEDCSQFENENKFLEIRHAFRALLKR